MSHTALPTLTELAKYETLNMSPKKAGRAQSRSASVQSNPKTPLAVSAIERVCGTFRVLPEKLASLSEALNADAPCEHHIVGAILARAEEVRLESLNAQSMALITESLPTESKVLFPRQWPNIWDATSAHEYLMRLVRGVLGGIRNAFLVENTGVRTRDLAWTDTSSNPLNFEFERYRQHLFDTVLAVEPPREWVETVSARLNQIGHILRSRKPNFTRLLMLIDSEQRVALGEDTYNPNAAGDDELVTVAHEIVGPVNMADFYRQLAGKDSHCPQQIRPLVMRVDERSGQVIAEALRRDGTVMERASIPPAGYKSLQVLIARWPDPINKHDWRTVSGVPDPVASVDDAAAKLRVLASMFKKPGHAGRGVKGMYSLDWAEEPA